MSEFNLKNYTNEVFMQMMLEEAQQIENIEFQNCQFKQCKFTGVIFRKVKFVDCDFESCDLSLSKFPGCKFSEVSFKDSKLAGINWTEISWPQIKLASPLYFYNRNISHSSFYGLELTDLIIDDCKAHDVDFREANLTHASFIGSDLQNNLFMHTNLNHANFTNAINYTIDIHFNTIKKAIFSYPEVIALLNSLDININGWPTNETT